MKKLISLALVCGMLSACSVIPYQPKFSQGNLLTPEKVHAIHVGMTADQVRLILGTPVLTNSFNASTWNYVYTVQKGPYIKSSKKMLITFSKGRVSHIELESPAKK